MNCKRVIFHLPHNNTKLSVQDSSNYLSLSNIKILGSMDTYTIHNESLTTNVNIIDILEQLNVSASRMNPYFR